MAEKIVHMLKKLEYRGYDSVGVALRKDQALKWRKDKGTISKVSKELNFKEMKGFIGIGHTRWATHGPVSKENAHPHVDCTGSFAVVHNGIIKNYMKLREKLGGSHDIGKTDTEVIPHLIESKYAETDDVFKAFKLTLEELEGSFAIAMLSKSEQERIYLARNFSPLLIGIGEDAIFLASDTPAFLNWTNKVIRLRDGDFGYVSREEIYLENLQEGSVNRPIEEVPWDAKMAKKKGYPHFMLKEIYEQPQAVKRTLQRGKDQIGDFLDFISTAEQLYITGAGTSFYATLHGEYSFAKYGLDSEAIISSEFVDKKIGCVDEDTTVLAVSQSGETADTLAALRKAKEKGAKITSITNTVGSTITRLSNKDLILGAGPEIGVAATKTFISQVTLLSSIALKWAERRGYDIQKIKKTLSRTPETISLLIERLKQKIKKLSRWMSKRKNCYFIGKGLGLPTALEGALKLKEIAYIHAEGYPAGESKHGPIALIEEGFPVVSVLLDGQEEVRGNIEELKSRKGKLITLKEGKEKIGDFFIKIPRGYSNILAPLTYVVPLQMLAYYTATERGHNPDKPRNLAKSVTVR